VQDALNIGAQTEDIKKILERIEGHLRRIGGA
jgi:hypothetical protein